jgi:hypothetical protein
VKTLVDREQAKGRTVGSFGYCGGDVVAIHFTDGSAIAFTAEDDGYPGEPDVCIQFCETPGSLTHEQKWLCGLLSAEEDAAYTAEQTAQQEAKERRQLESLKAKYEGK